jgi:putative drug exporter of the RND superfamily
VQAALPDARIASYESTGDPAFVSEDRRTTYALVYIPQRAELEPGRREARRAEEALAGVSVGGAPVEVTGLEALRAAGAAGEGDGPSVSVLIEVLVAGAGALIVLALVFGSLMAIVPLLVAAVAVPTTFLFLWPVAEVIDVSVFAQYLVALIGLGIAIDYALLVVLRWREERERGLANEAAVGSAMAHAGSAVVFSGTTVAIALLALLVLPVPFLRSVGIAGALIPLVSLAVVITLLPVVLATVGPRLDWPRVRRTDRAGRWWTAWAGFIVRNRWAAAIAAAAVLGALAATAFSIQLGNPRAESLAQSGTARAGLAELESSGIGAGPLSPFDALVRSGDPDAVADTLAAVDGIQGAVAPPDWRRDGTALVTAIPTEDGNSRDGRATLDRIRASAPAGVAVGGQAAQSADLIGAVYGNFPVLVALICGLTFILLARAFRSLVLSLKAVILNLLSVAAAWGVTVLVWQDGFGSEAIWGIEATRAIPPELPVMAVVFLFGISMDYQVFIISRMREAYDRTGSTRSAVVEGIGRTGRLVTSASLILGLAFISLSATPETEVKMSATILAGGILLDATIVRAMLLPAVVSILGRYNWWLPSWPARVLGVKPSVGRREAAAENT